MESNSYGPHPRILGVFRGERIEAPQIDAPMLDHSAILRLRRLDLVSSLSTGVIVMTGTIMLATQPGRSVHLTEVAFIGKLILFLVASGLVLTTKGFLRRALARKEGDLIDTPRWVLWALLVDFVSIGVIAATGAAVTHGWI